MMSMTRTAGHKIAASTHGRTFTRKWAESSFRAIFYYSIPVDGAQNAPSLVFPFKLTKRFVSSLYCYMVLSLQTATQRTTCTLPGHQSVRTWTFWRTRTFQTSSWPRSAHTTAQRLTPQVGHFKTGPTYVMTSSIMPFNPNILLEYSSAEGHDIFQSADRVYVRVHSTAWLLFCYFLKAPLGFCNYVENFWTLNSSSKRYHNYSSWRNWFQFSRPLT